MKNPETIVVNIRRRLSGKWHTHLAGEDEAFPYAFLLGRPAAAELLADYSAVHAQTVAWQDWARENGVVLVYETRAAKGGSRQSVPTHARVESIDHAVAIVADEWPERLIRGRQRVEILLGRDSAAFDIARTLRLIDVYSTVDFELLLTVADWYLEDPNRVALGITPRQVPIPGIHAKWLQNHRAGVQALTGLDDLGLLPGHPPRIHFTYLDPDHRASGGRLHDSATVGDGFTPAYLPEVVVISENKDTAIQFPPLTGGISVEGVGKGGKTPAAFSWIRNAPVVIYWGDIDRDGYEILNGYRLDFDRDIHSILMDPANYEEFEKYGTNLDKNEKPITAGEPRQVDKLREDERAVYLRILAIQHTGHRRVEQERIPLKRALAAVERVRRQVGGDTGRAVPIGSPFGASDC